MREVDISALKEIAARALTGCNGFVIECNDRLMMDFINAARPSVVLELIRRIEEFEAANKPTMPQPCKRCGCTKMDLLTESGKKPGSLLYAIQCLSCVARGPYAPTREEAIDGWNEHSATKG